MPRTPFQDVNALKDPLLQFNFELILPNVPGVSGYNAREFRTKIMSTAIPGRQIEAVVSDLHGVTRETAGRVQYSRSLPFEMQETRDMESRRVLSGWHRYARNDSSLGAYYSEYSTTAEIHMFDDHDRVVNRTRLYGCWLESFDDSAVDGSSSAAVTISGTLKFFRWEDLDL